MKILYIPLDYQRHYDNPELFTDIVHGLEGSIYQSKENSILYAPDVILFHGGLTPEELKDLKDTLNVPVFMWTGDCRYMPQESLMMYKDLVEAFMVPFSGLIKDRYSDLLGKLCYFLWEPIQRWRFKEAQNMNEGPISFVGNLYENLPGGEDRVELLSFLNKQIDNLIIKGSIPGCESVDNHLLPHIYNDSYIVIAENNIHDILFYFTPRNIGGMAAGSCVVMRYFTGIETFFTDGVDCFIYKHKYELLDIIHFLKKNPDVRNRVAKEFIKKEVKRFDKKMKDKFGKTFVSEHDFHMINIEGNNLFVSDQRTYNELLTSEWFWDQINADQVLVFQPDSKIISKDRNDIFNYKEYNYVGAPWPFQSHGGNGGLSWRTVWFMKKIIQDYPYMPSYGNEDLYFCNIMHENNYGLAPEQVCKAFSVESIFQLGTFGTHDIERYLTKEQCEKIYNQ